MSAEPGLRSSCSEDSPVYPKSMRTQSHSEAQNLAAGGMIIGVAPGRQVAKRDPERASPKLFAPVRCVFLGCQPWTHCKPCQLVTAFLDWLQLRVGSVVSRHIIKAARAGKKWHAKPASKLSRTEGHADPL